nr:SLC13 family permease [Candidatus Nitrososphaera evergladensis]
MLGKLGLVSGPLLFIILAAFFPFPDEVTFEQRVVLGATAWMVAWWISEALPIYVTALLPIVLFPLFGVTDLGDTAARYADRIIFLFLGGFIIAKAVEKTGLHTRFALNILRIFGTNPKYVVAAFVIVTGFLSAWLSNTATAMLMVPIAAAVIALIDDEKQRARFGVCLMLAVAYSASLGGMATLVGTPPNAVFASLSKSILDTDVTFSQWMVVGMPVSAVSLFVAWAYLVNLGAGTKLDAKSMPSSSIAGEKSLITKKLAELGKMSRDEKMVAAVFLATAIAWVSRGLLWKDLVPMVDDSMIAIAAAVSLFLIPAAASSNCSAASQGDRKKKEEANSNDGNMHLPPSSTSSPSAAASPNPKKHSRAIAVAVLDWESAAKIPWGVLILIGGGLALAHAFSESGLDVRIATSLGSLGGMNYIVIILVIVAVTIFSSEFISNTASAALIIPVAASLASSLSMDPILLMASVAVATSYGFVMPVGTPPNAIVFATGHITAKRMARAGLPLDVIGIVLVTVMTSLLAPLAWGK